MINISLECKCGNKGDNLKLSENLENAPFFITAITYISKFVDVEVECAKCGCKRTIMSTNPDTIEKITEN